MMDTDHSHGHYQAAEAMMIVLEARASKPEASISTPKSANSTDLEDLFLAHIGGMDAFARGLEIAAALLAQSPIPSCAKIAMFLCEGDGLATCRETDSRKTGCLAPQMRSSIHQRQAGTQ